MNLRAELSNQTGDRGVMAIVGYGFIGRRIGLTAAMHGWQVRGLSRSMPRPTENTDGDIELIIGDARDQDTIEQLLDGAQHVVYAAGTVKPAESNDHPITEVTANLEPLLTTLEATVRAQAASFTFLSSAGTVYGPEAPTPTPENTPLWPINGYGVLKVAAERYVNMYAHQYGFAADILRCSNVYGPGEPSTGSQGLIGITRSALLAHKPVIVYGDGSTRRDFVHVDDVATVVELLARIPEGVRILNVGSGKSTSVTEVIDSVARSIGIAPRIDRRHARSTDVPVVELDVTRLKELINYKPRSVQTALSSPDIVG